MDKITTLGRIFIAVALVVFGVSALYVRRFRGGAGAGVDARAAILGVLCGRAFFAAAAGILYQRLARPAATLLGVMFFLFVVLLHHPRIAAHPAMVTSGPADCWRWQLCGGAWVVPAISLSSARNLGSVPQTRRYFFAVAFVAFGIQHFVYARFAAGLGPPWFLGDRFGPISPARSSLPRAQQSF